MEDILAPRRSGSCPSAAGFRHDDPRYSDCERGNAHAHLRTALLGRNVAVGINDGELGPRPIPVDHLRGVRRAAKREITVQIIGE